MPLTPAVRNEFNVYQQAFGVLVVSVQPGGVAARNGIKPGDVISQVRGRRLVRPVDVDTAVYFWLKRDVSDFQFDGFRGSKIIHPRASVALAAFKAVVDLATVAAWLAAPSPRFNYGRYYDDYRPAVERTYQAAPVYFEQTIVQQNYYSESVAASTKKTSFESYAASRSPADDYASSGRYTDFDGSTYNGSSGNINSGSGSGNVGSNVGSGNNNGSGNTIINNNYNSGGNTSINNSGGNTNINAGTTVNANDNSTNIDASDRSTDNSRTSVDASSNDSSDNSVNAVNNSSTENTVNAEDNSTTDNSVNTEENNSTENSVSAEDNSSTDNSTNAEDNSSTDNSTNAEDNSQTDNSVTSEDKNTTEETADDPSGNENANTEDNQGDQQADAPQEEEQAEAPEFRRVR